MVGVSALSRERILPITVRARAGKRARVGGSWVFYAFLRLGGSVAQAYYGLTIRLLFGTETSGCTSSSEWKLQL